MTVGLDNSYPEGASAIMVDDLLFEVGKLAQAEGEQWRLDHAELMDAYSAIIENPRAHIAT